MDNIEIRVDDPEIEITDEYSVDYDLPIASANTLGGVKIGSNVTIDSDGKISVPVASAGTAGVVKVGTNLSIDENGVLSATGGASITVDSTLSTVSTNPVQNRVITSEINSTNTTVGNIQSSITAINGSIGDLTEALGTTNTNVATNSGNITNLQTAVQTNTDNISTNTSNIATNTLAISNLTGRVETAEDAITGLGNGLATLQGTVDPLTITSDTVVAYTDLDTNVWSAGNLTINRRGKTGFINIYLEGTLTLAASATNNLYQLESVPSQESYGVLLSDDGALSVTVTAAGYVVLQNLSPQHSISLTKLTGSVPVIFV